MVIFKFILVGLTTSLAQRQRVFGTVKHEQCQSIKTLCVSSAGYFMYLCLCVCALFFFSPQGLQEA